MTNPAPLPAVPLTIEGSWVMHQLFRFERPAWNNLDTFQKRKCLKELSVHIKEWEADEKFPSAIFTMFGHKADLMIVHFRPDAADLHQAELDVSRLAISTVLRQVHSYTSVVELGLYESSIKTYKALLDRGLTPHSEEWNAEIAATLERQREAMAPRLFPTFPDRKYICFYPMDRLRGEKENWYLEPIEERQRMMHEHGMIGRRYADDVKQIITGSIGLDDWEWGVDLFADDPLVFKRLIYEMRFDEVSAKYAKFGQFFIGVRVPGFALEQFLIG